jgi:hypothetical protein
LIFAQPAVGDERLEDLLSVWATIWEQTDQTGRASRGSARSRGHLFDRAGRSDHLAAVGVESTGADLRVSPTQPLPLPVAVDQDTPLLKDTIQKKRRPGLDSLKKGDVDPAAADLLKADGQPNTRQGTIIGKGDQQVHVRSRVLLAPRERAIKHRQANPVLGTEGTAKGGDERPMDAEVLALTRRKL